MMFVDHKSGLEDERPYRRSFGHTSKRSRNLVGIYSAVKGHGEDEATLRQLLIEYVYFFLLFIALIADFKFQLFNGNIIC